MFLPAIDCPRVEEDLFDPFLAVRDEFGGFDIDVVPAVRGSHPHAYLVHLQG